MENLFSSVQVEYDPDDLEEFFDFDLTEIEEDVFYEVLATRYNISIKKLSELNSVVICQHRTQSRVTTHRGTHCGDCGKRF